MEKGDTVMMMMMMRVPALTNSATWMNQVGQLASVFVEGKGPFFLISIWVGGDGGAHGIVCRLQVARLLLHTACGRSMGSGGGQGRPRMDAAAR